MLIITSKELKRKSNLFFWLKRKDQKKEDMRSFENDNKELIQLINFKLLNVAMDGEHECHIYDFNSEFSNYNIHDPKLIRYLQNAGYNINASMSTTEMRDYCPSGIINSLNIYWK